MALLGVKRFLTQLEEEAAYRKVISMLLEGVAANALDLDRKACRSYRERMAEIRKAIDSDTTVEGLLANAGAAVLTMGNYARETDGLLHAHDVETQNALATLAGTPADNGGTGGRAAASLHKSTNGEARAAAAADASIATTRLQECANEIREAAGQPSQALHREISRRPEAARNIGLDPVTELPCEGVAQAQFLSAIGNGEQKHVAVFVLGSAQRINLRFGRTAGDEVIRELKRYLAGQLDPADRLFRWPGPAIVALLSAKDPFDRVRARMKRFLEKPIERTFDINGRSVLIPLSVVWSVFPLSIPLAVPNRQIHDFIAGQGYRDEDPIPA